MLTAQRIGSRIVSPPGDRRVSKATLLTHARHLFAARQAMAQIVAQLLTPFPCLFGCFAWSVEEKIPLIQNKDSDKQICLYSGLKERLSWQQQPANIKGTDFALDAI